MHGRAGRGQIPGRARLALKDKKEPPAPADADLFRQALEGVTPLAPSNRATPAKPKPEPVPLAPMRGISATAAADSLSDHGAGNEPIMEFLRNGISRMTLRKLRRGQIPVQDSLDLHGLTSDAARKLLLEFLRESTQRDLRCVLIIHGKGRHKENGEGILKIRARHWLTQCAEVLAFCEAPPNQGGGGAVLLLLRSNAGASEEP
jgi:DNA-nicking Smr family endonuclease